MTATVYHIAQHAGATRDLSQTADTWPAAGRKWSVGCRSRLPACPAGLFRVLGPSSEASRPGEAWGPIRVVYVVNPSDAIVFFEEEMWFRQPDWLKQPRGPDVSPLLEWVPVITFFQVAFDMLSAANVAAGHGHNYAALDYARAWVEVSVPQAWSDGDTQRVGLVVQAASSAPLP